MGQVQEPGNEGGIRVGSALVTLVERRLLVWRPTEAETHG